jgi:tripartite-type tricarboxylate transporter receptor subunit TctC
VSIILGHLLLSAVAHAQSYPARTITLVVTAAAGGVTDMVARALGQKLTEAWGQQVVIENKGGAAHVVGAAAVAKAAPDGHTLMVAEAGTFVINPTLYGKGKLPYDEDRDFVPVTGLVRINHALIADRSLPAASVAELIALARERPGELTYGTAGIGSAPHMNIVLLETLTGAKLVPVHYRGAAPALNDLVGSHVKLMSVSVSLALPPWRSGSVKMLGVGSAKRLSLIADVPTIGESVPGFQATTWFGLFAPSGTPPAIVSSLNAQARRIFNDPVFQEKFLAPQVFESMAGPSEEFAAFIKSEISKWSKVIRDAKLKVD